MQGQGTFVSEVLCYELCPLLLVHSYDKSEELFSYRTREFMI